MHGGNSPDRDGGHTERTHTKGRTLRFNLQECDYQVSSNNEQLSMKHKSGGACHSQNKKYQVERSFEKMMMNHEAKSNAQPSNDSRSMTCRSECLSEHYIRAKKFAALRKNQHPKKQPSLATT